MMPVTRSKPMPVSTWRRGQRGERAVRVGIELDEDQVPDLDALRAALVHQRALGVAGWGQVDVDFRARTARAGVAHHPEIVFLVAVADVDFRDRDRRRENFAAQ